MDAGLTLDVLLRHQVYDVTLQRGTPPTLAELTRRTRAPLEAVRSSLVRLAAGRVVVLQPSSGEILMAPPFSTIPTSFVVHTRPHQSYANCAWDALGVSVMMREPAHIMTGCGCCGEAIEVQTRMDGPPDGEGVIHFAVPARKWWDDIVFT
jgi:hypothetical protein